MTIPRDVLIAAYGLSNQNQPETIASETTELLNVVTRAGRGLWAFAARINPEFFGTTNVISFEPALPGWSRPKSAELIWRIEKPSGAEVVVVPRSDLKADLARPALWRIGQTYRSAGNPLDPVNGDLTFFFSQVFAAPASLDSSISLLWPEQFDQLLILETGMYLALKDGRGDEQAVLAGQRDSWAQLFAAFLEHETANLVYRYGAQRTFHVPSLVAAHLAPAPQAA